MHSILPSSRAAKEERLEDHSKHSLWMRIFPGLELGRLKEIPSEEIHGSLFGIIEFGEVEQRTCKNTKKS